MRALATESLQRAAGLAGRLLPVRLRAPLERDPILLLLVPLLLAALLMRLANAIRYPSLHGFDSYAHATYVWHLLKTWTVPLASEGWGRFHPPLYYWLTAGLWSAMSALPPVTVLKALNVFYGAVGLVSAWMAALVARRYFGERRVYAWAAALFIVFLPVHIYTAPMLGNEGLSTVTCSVSLYLLVRFLERPDLRSSILLGLCLGVAMLTKFTAIVVVGSTGCTLVLWGLLTRRYRPAIVHLSVVVACLFAVSGWFYVRNVATYGNPFQMSRDFFATKRIESTIPTGQRTLSSYLTFDTAVLSHPSYANGPVLDNVWAGIYATAWFDAHGGWFFPSALYDSLAYRVGRILMVLGLAPTILVAIGLFQGLRLARSREADAVLLPMLVTTACMLAMNVIYTFENRIFTAVKASYLLPAIVPFSFWFALGLRTVAGWGTLVREATVAGLLAAAAFVVPVYTYQLVFEVPMGAHYWNSLAVLEAFAGFPDVARERLKTITVFNGYDPFSDLYLAHENLGTLALEDGDYYRALAELRRARSLVESQVPGRARHRCGILEFARRDLRSASVERSRAAVARARRRDGSDHSRRPFR
jgi:hypothetical protein